MGAHDVEISFRASSAYANSRLRNTVFGSNAASSSGAAASRCGNAAGTFDQGRVVDLQHGLERRVCCWWAPKPGMPIYADWPIPAGKLHW